MALIAFGINHNTAPVDVREKVAFSSDGQVLALESLAARLKSHESVILSTCNRTEIYADISDVDQQTLCNWLAEFHQLDTSSLAENCYFHTEKDAVRHLMRVASGLDSLVLGEPQILGQVKQAFGCSRDSGMINGAFEQLFQQTFAIAKRVRSDTDIGANAVSVAYASVQLAKHIFSSLKKIRVLLIGAGETIELVAKHLKEQQVSNMRVANRTLARAHQLADEIDASVITLQQIPEHLHEADIVISSTASPLPILGKGVVESALKQRRHKPMFLVDLAVPRDIENEVSELDDAYLYTVDDLQQIVQQNIQSRQSAAAKAEDMVNQAVLDYSLKFEQRASIDLVKNYREQSEALKVKLQQRALNQLADGKPAEEVIAELANKLTNSLIHAPTKAIKQAASSNDDSSLNMLQKALGLDSD